MKNNIIGLLLFAVAIVVCVSGCRSMRQPVTTKATELTKTVTIVEKDTVFKIEPDSSFYNAWIECVNGKPVIKSGSEKSTAGKHLNTPVVSLKDYALKVDCITTAQQLFATWKEEFIQENKSEIITLPPVEVEKKLSWWQVTQIWAGRILFGLLVVCLGITIIKKYLKPI